MSGLPSRKTRNRDTMSNPREPEVDGDQEYGDPIPAPRPTRPFNRPSNLDLPVGRAAILSSPGSINGGTTNGVGPTATNGASGVDGLGGRQRHPRRDPETSTTTLDYLKDLTSRSKAQTPAVDDLHKIIWENADKLSTDDMKALLAHCKEGQVVAMRGYRDALEAERKKMQTEIDRRRMQFNYMMSKAREAMVGDIVVLVKQKWTFEEKMEELGKEVSGANG